MPADRSEAPAGRRRWLWIVLGLLVGLAAGYASTLLIKEERDPITVIKWKEIYENLENATDRCEDVANIIEGVVLEHA